MSKYNLRLRGENMKLLIIGAGGQGKVACDIANLMGKWNEISFLDDDKFGTIVSGHKVIGRIEDYKKFKSEFDYAFVAIGDNRFRMDTFKKLEDYGYVFPVLVHPFSCINTSAKVGAGTVIVAGAVVNTDAHVGKGCIINTCASVDHDCIVGDGVHLSPGVHLGGKVSIGDRTWVCIGSTIINDINIGRDVIVAAGATVIGDVKDSVMVACVPARIIKNMNPIYTE